MELAVSFGRGAPGIEAEWRMVGTKPLSEPMLRYCYIETLGTNFSEIISEIKKFDNVVCEMVAISSRPQCVNSSLPEIPIANRDYLNGIGIRACISNYVM